MPGTFSLLRQEGEEMTEKASKVATKATGEPNEALGAATVPAAPKRAPSVASQPAAKHTSLAAPAAPVAVAKAKARGKEKEAANTGASIAVSISKAREGEKRKFEQTWDLIFALKNVDLKKPENRFSFDFQLPAGRGRKGKIAFIADSLLEDAKKHADYAIGRTDIERMAKDRKALKKMAKDYDFFVAEAPLMPLIGKSFGAVLGTRGKMPMPVPPKAKVDALVEAARNYIRVSLRNTPTIQVPIGSESMKDEDVQKNLEAVFNAIKERLPKGKNNIRAVFIKLTMGKPVKVEM